MNILAIETSCDETALTVLSAEGDLSGAQYHILGNVLYSQAAKHAEYGGVYPALAKREHQENLVPLTTEALREAALLKEATGKHIVAPIVLAHIREEAFQKSVQKFLESFEKPNIDLIAVTKGPGLEPALWTGISFAQTLSTVWDIPLIGVDHMEGHIASALLTHTTSTEYTLKAPRLPLLALLISGGHTELVAMKEWFTYALIGRTRDDAVGEAFDKVARLLDMPYPGGPEIAKAAARSRARSKENTVVLPRPMMHDANCDFSFSGLKTAVLYHVRDIGDMSQETKEDIARAFEDAARDVLVAKTKRALEETGAATLVVGGGVSANTHIREGLEALIGESFPEVSLCYPGTGLTGDNAVMIGVVAHLRHEAGAKNDAPLVATGSQSLAD